MGTAGYLAFAIKRKPIYSGWIFNRYRGPAGNLGYIATLAIQTNIFPSTLVPFSMSEINEKI
jgi:hypothetical protein